MTSVFSKINQIKINKVGVKLQAYVTLTILCNPSIQSKIRRNVYENIKIWKQRVSIFCTFYCKPSRMDAEIHNCYFNVFSPSIQWDNYSRKKSFFFKITWQMLSKLTESVRNCQHLILWSNHQNWNLSFRNFLLKYEPHINDKKLHDKEQKI